ncbi:TetR/AcrR family transcriptional regulator [Nakamurella silvestris]|nr:TetR/AcrR family transcriptional regulator [Nakamurella silvestris]
MSDATPLYDRCQIDVTYGYAVSMDPRTTRSRTALVAAVYRLASSRDISEITVAEITREAGLTRDTFYRHASDPVDLLATALHAELAVDMAGFHRLPATGNGDGTSVFTEPTRALLTHVAAHASVYRQSAGGRLGDRLRAVLMETARDILASHLRGHPEIAPPQLPADDPRAFDMVVAYAAGGTIAAVETWLAHGDITDIDQAVGIILSAAPQWWLG